DVRRYRCGGSAGDSGAARRWPVAGAAYHHLGTADRHPGTGCRAGLCPVVRALPGGGAGPAQPLPSGPGRAGADHGHSHHRPLGLLIIRLLPPNPANSSLLPDLTPLLDVIVNVLVLFLLPAQATLLQRPMDRPQERRDRASEGA